MNSDAFGWWRFNLKPVRTVVLVYRTAGLKTLARVRPTKGFAGEDGENIHQNGS